MSKPNLNPTTFKSKQEQVEQTLAEIKFCHIALHSITGSYLLEPIPERKYLLQRAFRNIQSHLRKLENQLSLNEPFHQSASPHGARPGAGGGGGGARDVDAGCRGGSD